MLDLEAAEAGEARALGHLAAQVGVQAENWDVLLYVNNALDDDTVRFTGGGPGLGCCFVLGSGIDVSPQSNPGSTVLVDLPTFNSAFKPPPRHVGLRATMRFGGD